MTDHSDLDRQVQESYKRIQQQNTGVAREYAEGAIENLRGQVEDTRSTLEGLTEQLPEGDLHPFRMVVQEMLDAFTWVTEALDNVEETVSSLDVTQYMEDAENVEDAGEEESDGATDETPGEASDEEEADEEEESSGEEESAEEEGLGEEEPAGEEESAEEEEPAEEEVRATAAARRKAEELGVELASLEGTGLNGIVTVADVTGSGG